MKIQFDHIYPRRCRGTMDFPLSSHLWWAIVIILPLFWGCAPGKEARQVAQITLANLVNYEKEVQKKIDAENSYYQKTMAVMQDALKWGGRYEERSRISSWVLDFDSFLANPKNRFDHKELRERLAQLLEGCRHSRLTYAEARAKYQEDLVKSLEPLEFQEKSIRRVQEGLVQMQVKSVDLNMLMGWVKLGKEMEDRWQKEKEARKAAPPAK